MRITYLLGFVMIIVSLIVHAADSDNDGLEDTNETWTAEWFNCSDERERLSVSSNINDYDSDNDDLNDYEERLWDLNPNNSDTDGDISDEGDTIYSFVDQCPKHCNDFCVPEDSDYWKEVSCNGNPALMYNMIEDYRYKINRLSNVFNSGDRQKVDYIFGLYTEWKYNDSNINFGDDWVDLNYDDSSWSSGDAYLGFAEFLITTTLQYGPDPNNKTVTNYFRKYFNITNSSAIDNLELNIDYDDGFVAYLNGNEITRSNGCSSDHYTTCPYHESTIGDWVSSWYRYSLNATELGHLLDGENVLAVEVHQTRKSNGSIASADLVLGTYMVSYQNVSSHSLVNNVSDMCNILNNINNGEEGLKRELLTLWLNVVASNLCYTEELEKVTGQCIAIASDTVEEVIGYAENVLINNITDSYDSARAEVNMINDGYCLDCIQCVEPILLNISLSGDNESPILDWDSTTAVYYNVYYSSNASLLNNYTLDMGDIPGISKYTNIPDSNFTDINARDVQQRYYRISTVVNSSECLGDPIKGKFTYYMYGNSTRTSPYYRSNWIAIPLNTSTTLKSKTDILDKCIGGRALRLHKLERDNTTHYNFRSQEFDFPEPDFEVYPGYAYNVEVETDCNLTIVGGLIYSGIKSTLYGGDYRARLNPYYRTNWIAANYVLDSYVSAADVIENVSNNAGLRLYTLVRDNSSHYSFETYERGVSSDYSLSNGVGYALEVNLTSEVMIR